MNKTYNYIESYRFAVNNSLCKVESAWKVKLKNTKIMKYK